MSFLNGGKDSKSKSPQVTSGGVGRYSADARTSHQVLRLSEIEALLTTGGAGMETDEARLHFLTRVRETLKAHSDTTRRLQSTVEQLRTSAVSDPVKRILMLVDHLSEESRDRLIDELTEERAMQAVAEERAASRLRAATLSQANHIRFALAKIESGEDTPVRIKEQIQALLAQLPAPIPVAASSDLPREMEDPMLKVQRVTPKPEETAGDLDSFQGAPSHDVLVRDGESLQDLPAVTSGGEIHTSEFDYLRGSGSWLPPEGEYINWQLQWSGESGKLWAMIDLGPTGDVIGIWEEEGAGESLRDLLRPVLTSKILELRGSSDHAGDSNNQP